VRRAFQDFATGRFTKHEVRKNLNALGLRTRRGRPVPSQAFDAMLRNRAYIAQIDIPDFGISTCGDFEPLISEKVFFRVQGVLDGRYEVPTPRQRNDPDFPLRGYVGCESCGKPLTASWSRGRREYYAYYHCRGRCRAVNISKGKLEELFVDELTRLQPTDGFMRLVKERVLSAWREMQGGARQRIAAIERKQKSIREKLDRLDEAFLYERTIEIDTYDRHRDQLREELTLAQMDLTPASSKKWTWRASWRSQSAFCRGLPNSGCRPRPNSDNGSNNCSFPTESRSTVKVLLEPA